MSPLAILDVAFDEHRLMFLAGSGVSLDSGLPSADRLLRQTLDLVLPNSCDQESRQRFAELQPEVVYEAIIRISGDRRCLHLWAALSTDTQYRAGLDMQPNDIHRLLVSYSYAAAVPLVTPNFDVMFERAAHQLDIPFQVYLPRDEPPRSFEKLAICKIHGSIETRDNRFDTETIWTTASEISTFNAPWINFLTKRARGKHWCFVGYSGRDIDLLPHLVSAVQGDLPIIWIDKFREDAPVTPNAKEANALLVDGWPSDIFFQLGKFVTSPIATKPDPSRLLECLALEFRREIALTSGQRTLLQAILARCVGSAKDALRTLNRISNNEFHALPSKSQVEFLRLRADCFHEVSRYQQLGKDGLRIARYGLQDVSAFIHGLIIHAESLRMRLPVDTYYSETDNVMLVARFVVVAYFLLVGVLTGACLIATRQTLTSLAPMIRHAVIEHGVRILAIIQRLVLHWARSPNAAVGHFLRRAWRYIYEVSHRYGYAGGMANARKFLYRISPEEGHGDAQRIYTMFADKTGLELLLRNEADAALARGDYEAALAGYREFGEMALRNGNILNAVKSMLGSFHARELQSPLPVANAMEFVRVIELSQQVEGRLWQRHFRKTIDNIRNRFSIDNND